MTEIQPRQADRIKNSHYAKLVSIDALRVLVGVFNRHSDRFPFQDKGARQAINLALNRKAIVSEALLGFATPLAGLTPPSASAALPHRLSPYTHDPKMALRLWARARHTTLPLRLAAESNWFDVADLMKRQFEAVFNLRCQLTIYELAEMPRLRRRLAEKKMPQPWDLLLIASS